MLIDFLQRVLGMGRQIQGLLPVQRPQLAAEHSARLLLAWMTSQRLIK